ncbi:MAG TPA: type II toxin-antitoxin system PemK/MazF family toxin [Candidatus Saccharimonadales bacterium]|jgi:mRNA interferase MazF
MGKFVIGDVVAVPFPFSDLSSNKLRPAIVLAEADYGDVILCQITSTASIGKKTVALDDSDFKEGDLPLKSYARTDKLFTAEDTIIVKRRGKLNSQKFNSIINLVKENFTEL